MSDVIAYSRDVTSDPERLAVLESYGILDTPAEAGFDGIVELATEICQTPVALVSLVAADRQWFKARIGFESCETPLEQSVCSHALRERDILVIPDLTLDPRTAANPLVADAPFVRFYAGVVLVSPEGQPIGTLCVLDTEPRPGGLTESQTSLFRKLGAQVMALLELRRTVDRSREAILEQARSQRLVAAMLERYELVGKATNDAIWDWELTTDHVLWNDALTRSYGWPLADVEPTPQWWVDRIHPDDRERVYADIRAVIDGDANEWRHEYRFRCAAGHYAAVFDRGYMILNELGAPHRMIGAMLDLTERREAEDQFRAVFEGANVGIVELDPLTARALRVNAKLCEIWGTTAEEILGHSIARWTPEEDDAERAALHARLARGEQMQTLLEKRYRRADGRIIWARVNLVSRPLRDRIHATAMIEDITAEKETEVRDGALVELGTRLRDLTDAREIAQVACDILGRTLAIDRASFGTVDPRQKTVAIEVDWHAADMASAVGVHDLDRFGDLRTAVSFGKAYVVDDVHDDPRTVACGSDYAAMGIRALLHAPILERGELVALFFLHAAAPRRWSPEIVTFVLAVADRTQAAVERARAEERQRLLNHELSHRMKNLIAMAQAIASQTMRNASDMAAAREMLMGRLVALGEAQDILLTGASQAAAMTTIVDGAIKLHRDRADRFSVSGPDVELGSKAALPLILMMHELGTNAAKYGALSNAEGRVAIAWSLDGAPGAEALRLTWTERGGPTVATPGAKGFGSRLIERGLAGQTGGVATLDYDPAGVVCTFQAPLAKLQETG